MALIVENGSGLVDAESYASVAEADSYFIKRSVSSWGDVGDKEAALRKATDYMVRNYRGSWKGAQVYPLQALDWPRVSVVAEGFSVGTDTVPVSVRYACIELALRASVDDLAPDLDRGVIEETIGPITTKYDPVSPQYKRFRVVDMLLTPFLNRTGVCVSVGRS